MVRASFTRETCYEPFRDPNTTDVLLPGLMNTSLTAEDVEFQLCPRGHFCIGGASIRCPLHTYNPATGQSSIDSCVVCPKEGVLCITGYSITVLPGWAVYSYFVPANRSRIRRALQQDAQADAAGLLGEGGSTAETLVVISIPCPIPQACVGGAVGECMEGHTGVLCNECLPLYQMESGSCVPSPTQGETTTRLLFGLFVLALLFFAACIPSEWPVRRVVSLPFRKAAHYLYGDCPARVRSLSWLGAPADPMLLVPICKILIGYGQTLGSAWMIIPLPAYFGRLSGLDTWATPDSIWLIRWIVPSFGTQSASYATPLLAAVCMPLLLTLGVQLLLLARRPHAEGEVGRATPAAKSPVASQSAKGSSPMLHKLRRIIARLQTVFAGVCFSMLPSILRTLLGAIDCLEIGPNVVLRALPSQLCNDSAWQPWQAFAVLTAVAYHILLPLLALIAVGRYHIRGREKSEGEKSEGEKSEGRDKSEGSVPEWMGLLELGYAPGQWWIAVLGETADLLRRLFLAGGLIPNLSRDPNLQAWIGYAISGVGLFLQIMVQPFQYSSCNRIQTLALLHVNLVYQSSAILLTSGTELSPELTTARDVAQGTTVGVILAWVAGALLISKKQSAKRREEEAKEEAERREEEERLERERALKAAEAAQGRVSWIGDLDGGAGVWEVRVSCSPSPSASSRSGMTVDRMTCHGSCEYFSSAEPTPSDGAASADGLAPGEDEGIMDLAAHDGRQTLDRTDDATPTDVEKLTGEIMVDPRDYRRRLSAFDREYDYDHLATTWEMGPQAGDDMSAPTQQDPGFAEGVGDGQTQESRSSESEPGSFVSMWTWLRRMVSDERRAGGDATDLEVTESDQQGRKRRPTGERLFQLRRDLMESRRSSYMRGSFSAGGSSGQEARESEAGSFTSFWTQLRSLVFDERHAAAEVADPAVESSQQDRSWARRRPRLAGDRLFQLRKELMASRASLRESRSTRRSTLSATVHV